MSTIETVLLALLVVDALALTVLVLIQQGKGADVGAAFGSGSSSTMFGSAGTTSFLTRATTWLAVGFFAIAFGLAYLAKERAAAAGSLGIPTVSAPASTGELTESAESADSQPADGDVPTLESIQPEIEKLLEQEAAKDNNQNSDVPEI